MRVLPVLWKPRKEGFSGDVAAHIVLPVFRAMAFACAGGKYPAQARALRDAAGRAARAAALAALGHSDDAALTAARAATAAAAPDAATAAAATAAAAPDTASAAAAFHADVQAIESGLSADRLVGRKSWPERRPQEITRLWARMKKNLLARGEDWEVWTQWYEARLAGKPSIEALEIARVMIPDDIWRQGPKVVNAGIKDLIAEHTAKRQPPTPPTVHQVIAQSSVALEARATVSATARGTPRRSDQAATTQEHLPQPAAPPAEAQEKTAPASRMSLADLAEVASPAPFIAADGRLDAGPNAVFDVPNVDDELPTLPIRQRVLIQTILSDLPLNAPVYLRASLNSYDEELNVRGVRPILGLLKDMAAIIQAAVDAPDAGREWLATGLVVAFQCFQTNHQLFITHFPLDLKREDVFARISVDEEKATGAALTKPFEEVANATIAAHAAGLTTDDFVKIVGSMTEFAKVVASQPPLPAESSSASPSSAPLASPQLTLPHVGPDDKLIPTVQITSTKKRILLTGLAFFERTYNLLGTTVTLMSTPYGILLLAKLGDAINAFSQFITH
ncbi:MAG: hypothetical protein ACLQLT_15245 [Methylovirgula sp.]